MQSLESVLLLLAVRLLLVIATLSPPHPSGYEASVKSVNVSRADPAAGALAFSFKPAPGDVELTSQSPAGAPLPQTLTLRVESMVCSMCEGVLEK
jgi:hypothetical protein